EILKPDVILFEEQLPANTWVASKQALDNCDLLLVIGSSLSVVPVADLPVRAIRKNANIIIINEMATDFDKLANIVIHRDVAEILPKITKRVLYV
ncbi:MAG: hypothetical protein B6243_07955, partial [Anaerolineaceae bacterium 4572_5.2]